MKRFQCVMTGLALALCPALQAWADKHVSPTALATAKRVTTDMIQLFADCGAIELVVYVQDGEKIGLTEESVKTAVRSRLRSARLYRDPPAVVDGILRVSVLVGREDHRPFTHRVWFEKQQLDNKTGISGWSPTGWDEWKFGTHGDDANYVLSSIAPGIDKFINDYLRVNEAACGKPKERTPRLIPLDDDDPFEEKQK